MRTRIWWNRPRPMWKTELDAKQVEVNNVVELDDDDDKDEPLALAQAVAHLLAFEVDELEVDDETYAELVDGEDEDELGDDGDDDELLELMCSVRGGSRRRARSGRRAGCSAG